ncbi:polysaccharide biosynthesis tyrosine autokinase [Mesorhizobium sp.]|uniref:GumC family protein n=1 Tax=Mesorhizobium sp. TaxID=1871066 RepID=UPI0025BDDE91|nr:polysaccharide biosynthesis tyrosine autokinase [Mesorhizobium sp.]
MQTGKETLARADVYDDPRPRIQEYAYEPAHEQGLDILQLFLYAVHYRWLLVTLAAVGLTSSLAVTMMMTPKYAATAQLEVLVPSAKVFQDIELTSESSDARSFLTASEKLKSRSVAQRVVFNLGLSEREDFLFPKASFSPANILNRALGISDRADISKYSADDRARMAVDRVLANLSVVPITNTSLLSITYSDQRPRYAYEIANQVAQSFIDQRVDQANTTSVLARKFIQEQVLQTKERLQQSEQSLVDYAKKAGITLTGNDNSLITSNLTEINTALARAIQENLDYGRLVQQIDNGQGASLEQVLNSEALDKMRSKLSELDADYQQKLGLFKPDFPEMQQLRSQMRTIESQLNQGIQAITDSIRLKHRETLAKVDDLKKKLAELQSEQVAYQDKNIQYTILKREVDSNRSQYESLIAKLNEVAIGSKLKDQNAAVVDLAVLPRSPFSPRLSLNVAIGLVLSMVLGAATVYVLELLNNTFVDPEQLESELRLPILGILPAVDEREVDKAITDSKSGLSESYRSLRTSLQFSGDQGVPRVLLVASSIPSEGKSTTVRKLAGEFAALGAKVLVIDADLRRPTLHRAFSVDNDVGLTNVLTSTVRRDDVPKLVKRAGENLSVMTAGIIPPNPADLLSSPRMGLLLQKINKTYDIVIIDSAPVIGLSDAPILSRLADTTLLVVSTQVTRKAARAALKRIQAAGANVVGAAFTKFSPTKFGYSHNYKYSRYYYNYGEESPRLENKVGQEATPRHAKNWSFADVSDRLHGYLRDAVDRIKSSS